MDLRHFLIVLLIICARASALTSVFTLIHDVLQNNLAGIPLIHEKTDWDFDPDVGQQRRVRYEMENGRVGSEAIDRLGMGVGYIGPWGIKSKSNGPVRHVRSLNRLTKIIFNK